MARQPGLHVDQRFPNPGMEAPSAQPGDYDPNPQTSVPQRNQAVTAGVETLPPELVGDIPPPPIPPLPQTLGSGVGGIRGTEAGTLSLPGSRGAVPFRSNAFQPKHPPRFGPGVPLAGGGSTDVSGLDINPDDAAELLRELARGRM